jgi:hypothetical protein
MQLSRNGTCGLVLLLIDCWPIFCCQRPGDRQWSATLETQADAAECSSVEMEPVAWIFLLNIDCWLFSVARDMSIASGQCHLGRRADAAECNQSRMEPVAGF